MIHKIILIMETYILIKKTNLRIMELWDYGIMELWDYGIMGLWDYG
jgi:hypothetical protein